MSTAETASARTTPTPRGWLGLVAPGIAMLVALAILLGLGVWQLERKSWKEALIARITARSRIDPPVALPAPADWNPERDEFRRVRATGTFLNDRETPVYGLAAGEPGRVIQGYYILTPLRLADGTIVLVNRGIVPTELRDPKARPAGEPQGETTVTGVLRASETRGTFVPQHDPARDSWFTKDIPAIAADRGLSDVAPYLIEADATPNPGGWPRGGNLRVDLPNNHLQYAFTWFALAACLVGTFVVFARRQLHPDTSTLDGDRRSGSPQASPEATTGR